MENLPCVQRWGHIWLYIRLSGEDLYPAVGGSVIAHPQHGKAPVEDIHPVPLGLHPARHNLLGGGIALGNIFSCGQEGKLTVLQHGKAGRAVRPGMTEGLGNFSDTDIRRPEQLLVQLQGRQTILRPCLVYQRQNLCGICRRRDCGLGLRRCLRRRGRLCCRTGCGSRLRFRDGSGPDRLTPGGGRGRRFCRRGHSGFLHRQSRGFRRGRSGGACGGDPGRSGGLYRGSRCHRSRSFRRRCCRNCRSAVDPGALSPCLCHGNRRRYPGSLGTVLHSAAAGSCQQQQCTACCKSSANAHHTNTPISRLSAN